MLHGIVADVQNVLRRSSQDARACSGAEAVEQLFRSSIDDAGAIVRDDLLTDLIADLASLPSTSESM